MGKPMCEICSHPDRAEIEKLILSISPTNPSMSLETIADAYGVSAEKLRIHALMHSPLALDFSKESEDVLIGQFRDKAGLGATSTLPSDSSATNSATRDRLTDKVNMREGDMLLAAANEYLTTMVSIGRRIKRYSSEGTENGDAKLLQFLSTPTVNLYIGAGTEMRKMVAEIRGLNESINGSKDSAAAGLQALANALAGKSEDSAEFLDTEFTDHD